MQYPNVSCSRLLVPPFLVWALAVPMLLASGCSAGHVLGAGASANGDSDTLMDANSTVSVAAAASAHLPEASACTSAAPAPRGLRRLTRVELNNTLLDLFGDPNAPQSTSLFNGDAKNYGFDNIQTVLSVRDNQAMVLSAFAETVGTYAAGRATQLSACQTTDATCREAFITSFGRKAFRAPLTAAQVADYDALMAQSSTFPDGVNVVVTAMVQSPYFLYRSELGILDPAGSGNYILTPYEIAAELSYMLTGTMPDEALAAAADANALSDPNSIRAQAERLVATPKAHAAVDRFFMEWLQVADLDLQARSEGTDILDPATKAAMQNETQAFVDDTVFAQNGTFKDLLSRDVTFVSPALAQYYTGSSTPTPITPAITALGLSAISASAAGRLPGVLGHGGVLAAASQPTYASPTLRGRMLRMRILCGSVPAPPPGIPPLPTASGAQTLRQRFEAHTGSASCTACHTMMDPLAFPLGGYDTLGRARAGGTENGLPIDLTGNVVSSTGSLPTVPVSSAAELITTLAQSPEAAACLSRHWTMYALGRLSWPEDSCTFDAVAQGAALTQNNLQGMLLALTAAKSFTTRVKDI